MRPQKLAPLTLVLASALVFALAGCASDDGDALVSAPTEEEATAGADGIDPADHEDAEPQAALLDTPIEDSAPFLDPAMESSAPPVGPEVDMSELETATSSCQRATGYRQGKAFTICVTYVDGKPVEVNTARVFLKMRAAAKARGVSIKINSGFRTMAQQKYLYNLYLQGKGNLAAKPGYSNHQSGHALDLNTSASGVYNYLANHGRTYGFRRTVPSERWHWEQW